MSFCFFAMIFYLNPKSGCTSNYSCTFASWLHKCVATPCPQYKCCFQIAIQIQIAQVGFITISFRSITTIEKVVPNIQQLYGAIRSEKIWIRIWYESCWKQSRILPPNWSAHLWENKDWQRRPKILHSSHQNCNMDQMRCH